MTDTVLPYKLPLSMLCLGELKMLVKSSFSIYNHFIQGKS